MKLFHRIAQRLSESRWAALGSKIALGAGTLLVLALVGSGAFDRLLGSRTAHAEGEARKSAVPTASASSSAAPPPSSSAPVASAAPSASAAPPRADGMIVLATATEADLEKLPGIGPGKAKKIVELREKLGRFKKLEDLYRIKGIKRRLLEKIRPHVVLEPDDPAPKSP